VESRSTVRWSISSTLLSRILCNSSVSLLVLDPFVTLIPSRFFLHPFVFLDFLSSTYRNGQFELLLRKDAAQDNEARVELRIALHRYLLEHLPHDTEKLQLLFLSFNMWRELAENLKKKADEKLRGFAASSSMKSNSSRDLSESFFRELPNVLEMYLDAADYFVKERCYHVSNRCIALANLVTLQIQEPDQRVLSLTPQEAKNFMGSLNCSYPDAVILAEAYEVDSSEWGGPLFSQITQSNFGFVEEFMKTNPPSLVFQELAKKVLIL
jgi:hypothetical protein